MENPTPLVRQKKIYFWPSMPDMPDMPFWSAAFATPAMPSERMEATTTDLIFIKTPSKSW